jgi:hypothetical protein
VHYPMGVRWPPTSNRQGVEVGQAIMVGSLATVIVVIVGLVLRFDPEAKRIDDRERTQ